MKFINIVQEAFKRKPAQEDRDKDENKGGPVEKRKPWAIIRQVLWVIAIALSVLFAVLVFLLVAGTILFAPLANNFAMISYTVWPGLGLQLVVLSLLATVVLGYMAWRRRRVLSIIMASVAVVAAVGSAGINMHQLSFIKQHGGSVNTLSALFPTPDPRERTALEEYSAPNGKTYPIAVFAPKKSTEPAPIIMYVHGGGFSGGSFEDLAADDHYFAQQGYLVFDVEYPLWTPSEPTWKTAPAALSCALAWVGENSSRWNGDPTKITLAGGSAGGNLATLVAYAAAAGKAPACADSVPVPAAVAVEYPAVDPIKLVTTATNELEGFIGGPLFDHPDRVAAISPETYFSSKTPPTMLLQPAADIVVPPKSVSDFAKRAQAAGIDVTMIDYPYGNHTFDSSIPDSIANQAWRSFLLNFLKEKNLAPGISAGS
ncbi:alpha/beta hydrolase [Paenibacillus polymyxa]|uniref:alpha/beta hydrolase n=1 Tax=Paenibacillus polymyxa TaxID=1406 RepID=UPI002AB49695|nr:alpha/beta hydrolase [Paenibacillus polymyxa]MDY8025500.1 alpha/beta hydrolase [Paenibacillus polymyxa]